MSENKPEFMELKFCGLSGLLESDELVDGVAVIDDGNIAHAIPFGEDVPKSGDEKRRYGIWNWNGNKTEPTLSPSIAIGDMHVHLEDGEAIDV